MSVCGFVRANVYFCVSGGKVSEGFGGNTMSVSTVTGQVHPITTMIQCCRGVCVCVSVL